MGRVGSSKAAALGNAFFLSAAYFRGSHWPNQHQGRFSVKKKSSKWSVMPAQMTVTCFITLSKGSLLLPCTEWLSLILPASVSDTLLCLGTGKLKSSFGVTGYYMPSRSSDRYSSQIVSGFLTRLYFSLRDFQATNWQQRGRKYFKSVVKQQFGVLCIRGVTVGKS